MADFRQKSDPDADCVAAAIIELGGEGALNSEWRRLLATPAGEEPGRLIPLILLGRLPSEAREAWARLVDQSDSFNTNLARDARSRLLNGQRFFATWAPALASGYLTCSLPNTYAAANGVRVLWATARLQTDAERRVLETCRLLLDVMKPQDGLDDKARTTILQVRLMHAYVRESLRRGTWHGQRAAGGVKRWTSAVRSGAVQGARKLARRCDMPPAWNAKAWGVPINQDDLVATLMAFAYLPIDAMRHEPIGGEDVQDGGAAEDYVFAWAQIGPLLGISAELAPLLPTTLADAQLCWERFAAREQDQTCHGRELTKALIRATERAAPGLIPDPVIHESFVGQLKRKGALSRRSPAELLGIRGSRFWRFVYECFRRLLGGAQLQPPLPAGSEARGYDIFKWIVSWKSKHREQQYQLPESLREIWGLDAVPAEAWKRPRFGFRERPLSQQPGVLRCTELRERAARWAPAPVPSAGPTSSGERRS